jgi:hypothetical protein
VLGGQRGQAQRALEVDVHRLVEQFGRHVLQRRRHRGDPGVVDEHVDAAELGDGGVDERAALLPVADVAGHREGPPPEGPNLGGDHLAGVELAAGHHDVGASLGEAEGHRPAEALGGAGHHDHLAGRAECGDGHRLGPRLPVEGGCGVASRAMPSIR